MPFTSHERGPSIDSKVFAVPDASFDEDDTESVSSYAGSGENVEDDSANTAVDHLNNKFAMAFDCDALDRAIVVQAQTSGVINAKQYELEQARLKAQQRLAETKIIFADGIRNAKKVSKDLDALHRKTQALHKKMRELHPIEYQRAHDEVRDM
ncbi:hypothetical protein TRVA0_035S01662 [Trichomonascus vanleenenianus]|uniref:Kxd1p n=1 Tax=Trichomonascus vanleenenianus TaxID=2268995 RepID=UPI003ECA9B96